MRPYRRRTAALTSRDPPPSRRSVGWPASADHRLPSRSREPAPAPSGSPAGAPRSLHLDPTGERLLFLRSTGGSDPVGALWTLDIATGEETAASPTRSVLLADGGEQLSPAERARRERSREAGGGIVGYATDRDAPGRGVRAVQPAVAGGPRPAARPRAAGGRPGHRPAAGPDRAPGSPTPPRAGCTSSRRRHGRADPGRGRRGRRLLGGRRVRRGRGDGALPRLLVVAGRHGRARRPGRRVPGAALVRRRPGPPGDCRPPRCLPGRRQRQRRGDRARPRPGRLAHRRRLGPGGVPVRRARPLGAPPARCCTS